MTLRRRVSPVLLFGSRAILVKRADFRPAGFVPPGFPGFALFGSLAILEKNSSVDPMALRHRVSPVLPFFECNCILAQTRRGFK